MKTWKRTLGLILGLCLIATPAPANDKGYNQKHLEEVAKANASVAAGRAACEADPLRPIYHVLPESRLCGDPDGPIFAKGKYHIFFQHRPYFTYGPALDGSGTGWGHASSPDLVHWQHEPVALMTVPGSYDADYCASGCCVINDDGVPTIIYTSVSPQAQSLAMSTDPDLRFWTKYAGNPVIPAPPDIPGFRKGDFRDPYVFKENGTWYMLVGAGIKNKGGTILLYTSDNLFDWKYEKQLLTGMGEHCKMWEVPNLLRFDNNKAVLFVLPLFDNVPSIRRMGPYVVGTWQNGTFTPDGDWQKYTDWHKLDIGYCNNFVPCNSQQDPNGRWLLWGMVLAGGNIDHPWWGKLSLPRVVALRDDNLLSQEPPPELAALRRGRHWHMEDSVVKGLMPLEAYGNAIEILVEIEPGNAKSLGIDVRGNSGFTEKTRIEFDAANSLLCFHEAGNPNSPFTGDFELLQGENVLRLHIFIDKCVVETFVNKRECGTIQAWYNVKSDKLRLFSKGGAMTVTSLDVWELDTIWKPIAETLTPTLKSENRPR